MLYNDIFDVEIWKFIQFLLQDILLKNILIVKCCLKFIIVYGFDAQYDNSRLFEKKNIFLNYE